MTRFFALILLGWACLAGQAGRAESIVAGFSHDSIAITARFDGSEIIVFGAVKREEPVPHESPLGVIVTIEGPTQPIIVRRKDRRFGIWMNTEGIRLEKAPSFYSVSTTWPVSLMLTPEQDQQYEITLPRTIRTFGRAEADEFAPDFNAALIRIRTEQGLYQLNEGGVALEQSTLFQTRIAMPARLVEGDYLTRIFLTRNGQVIDRHESTISVQKVGLERWIYTTARGMPVFYGLLSITIAAVAGWAASAAFRFLRF